MKASEDAVPQLTLTGAVAEDVRFSLGFALAHAVPAAQDEPAGATRLAVDLLDASGNVLLRTMVLGTPMCTLPAPDTLEPPLGRAYLVQSLIPLVEGVETMVVREPGRELLRREFPANPPQISSPEVKRGEASFTVRWKADHPDGAPLEHAVVARDPDADPADWTLASLPSELTEIDVMPTLRAKRLEFAVITTDGLHTVLSDPVEVEPTPPLPAVAIISPTGLVHGSPLALVAYSSEEGVVGGPWGLTRVEWRGSDDVVIGVGPSILAYVKPGKHILTARLFAEDGATLAEDTVEVVVTETDQLPTDEEL